MLLRTLAGPACLTSHVRKLGDSTTRLDRIETELSEATPGDGDVRDTTSPRAMPASLHKLAIGDALKPASRERLSLG
jgi:beta-lactamase class A